MSKYRVAPGVERINAAPVPKNRVVDLTDAEALFDLALGRLLPINAYKPANPKADDDGGN